MAKKASKYMKNEKVAHYVWSKLPRQGIKISFSYFIEILPKKYLKFRTKNSRENIKN